MTAPVASPSMSPPDSGATAAKNAAAAPNSDTAFGAMLSEVEATPDTAAPAAAPANATGSEDQGSAAADAAALAVALNQTPWLAQVDATKILPQSQDRPDEGDAATAANPPAQNPPQSAASQAPVANLPVPLPAPAEPAAAQATPSQAAPSVTPPQIQIADEPTAVPMNAAPALSVAENNSNDAAVAEKPVPADHPKEQKPAHADADADADQSVPQNVTAFTDLSSPLAAQLLAVPTPQAQQSTPAPRSQSNPGAKPEDSIAAASAPAAAQAAPVALSSAAPASTAANKNANPKNAVASDAKSAAASHVPSARDAHAPATTDSPQATANTSDAPERTISNAPALTDHGAKNDTAAAAPSLPESAPIVSAVSNHATAEMPTVAVGNTPTGASSNADAPVKLAFAAPNTAEVPSFDALALKIAARSLDGENNFSIRLDPPELGRIEVNLNVRSDGHAQAELSADKPATLELLQKDASSLERALKDAGLNLAGGLAFSLKGDGKSQAWRDTQSGSRGRTLEIAAVDAANANADMAVSAALAAHAYGVPTARLDIRV